MYDLFVSEMDISQYIIIIKILALLTLLTTPKVPLYNLKTLKFYPAKSILLQFLPLNTKLLINKFLLQKTDLRKKGNKEDFLLATSNDLNFHVQYVKSLLPSIMAYIYMI